MSVCIRGKTAVNQEEFSKIDTSFCVFELRNIQTEIFTMIQYLIKNFSFYIFNRLLL